MNRDNYRIFESYTKKGTVLTEAPIYASSGDIDIKKVKTHSKQGYAIGDHARKTNTDVDQLTQNIVDQVKSSVFLNKQSVVKGKKYDLFFPGTMDQFRDRLTSIVGQTLKPQMTRASDWKYSARIIANDVIQAIYADGEDVPTGTVTNSAAIDNIEVKNDIAKAVTNAVSGATPEAPAETPAETPAEAPTEEPAAQAAPLSNDQELPSPETVSQTPIDSPAIAKKVAYINKLPFNITKQYEVAPEVALNDEDLRIAYHRLVKRIGVDRPVYGRDLANCLMGTMSYPMAKEMLIKLVAANAVLEADREDRTDTVEVPTIEPGAEEDPKVAQDEEMANMIRSQAGGKTLPLGEGTKKVVVEATPYGVGSRTLDYFKTKLPTLAPNTAATASGRAIVGQDANTKYREMLKSLATAGIREDQITPQILKNYAQNNLGISPTDLPSLRHLKDTTPIRNPAQAFLEIIHQGNRASLLPGYTSPAPAAPRSRKGRPSIEEYSEQLAKTLGGSGVTIDPKVLSAAMQETLKQPKS